MARPGEPEAVRTTIVGGRPPAEGANVNDVPRGVEVLVKKAAVDPKFRKLLLEKRAAAAPEIALKLEPAEEAMLDAVPGAQLEAIVANTKVSPKLRPAFLGYAAGAMLSALGTKAPADSADNVELRTYGVDAEMPPKAETAATAEKNAIGYGTVSGVVTDADGQRLENVEVIIVGTGLTLRTNKEGYFAFTSVPEGLYEMKASHEELGVLLKTGIKVIPHLRTIVSFHFGDYETYPEESIITGIRPDFPAKEGD